jgi:hypothetical protein
MVIALERLGSLPSLLLVREHRFSDFAGILTQWQEMMNVWQLLEKIGFSPDDRAVALFPTHVITKLRECAEKVPSHQSLLLESKGVMTDCFSKVDQLSFHTRFFNEPGFIVFYQRHVNLLQCANKLKILHEFFPDVVRLTTITEDARGKVKNEIDRLFEQIQNHLDDFPLQEGDFKRIYTFLYISNA